jgi:hypothetical protein
MGRNHEVGVLASGDGDSHGRRKAAGGPAAVDDLPDGADVDGIAIERFREGGLELGGAGSVEDLQEPCSRAADVVAALGDDS